VDLQCGVVYAAFSFAANDPMRLDTALEEKEKSDASGQSSASNPSGTKR
jgi:hypothetical protein